MNFLRKAWTLLREQGVGAVIRRSRVRLFGDPEVRTLLVRVEDALAVDPTEPHPAVASPLVVRDRPLRTAWVMSPPGANSGGHQNIFRFMRFLEQAGHRTTVYLYSSREGAGPDEVRALLASSTSYPKLDADIRVLPADGVPDDTDALFATGWETAYPVFRDRSPARRFYFVQDFEPWFYPAGSEYALAESTYRFGFEAFTAGAWLSQKLAGYGMTATPYPFAADLDDYRFDATAERSEVFFYARPATERRGFELGMLALELFVREHPDVVVNLVGEDLRSRPIWFPHRNLRGLGVADLSDLYNRCSVALVLSFSNLSLLPLELLACGVIPVVNDAENNRLVADNPFIEYAPPNPRALAARLGAVVLATDRAKRARAAAESVPREGWTPAGRIFVDAVERTMRG